MNILTSFWNFLGAKQPVVPTAETAQKNDATVRMLTELKHLCATLPMGEVEVYLSQRQINIHLSWDPKEEDMNADMQEKGIVFLLNGQSDEVRYEEVKENNVSSPESSDNQCAKGETLQPESHVEEEVKDEKPSKQMQTLRQLREFLQLHYAFRYNKLSDCTECAKLSLQDADGRHRLVYQPVNSRLLNSISLNAMDQGIACWDRDVKRFVESAELPTYHPFIDYMKNLPKWDGQDRVTPLAQRVASSDLWVRSFHRWMLAMAAQWMEGDAFGKRANSVAPLLVSKRQGLGKSTFCRLLMPDALQTYFTESFDLTNPAAAENKLTSFGLINIDEFDRLPAGRMSLLKNLMQMERINLRRAYKHSAEPLPRIANFIATSNSRELLTDRTGSRRFICVEVDRPIDCETPIDYSQLYAQLKHEITQGERTWFNKDEEAEIQQANQAFYRIAPAEELLANCFELCEADDEGAHLRSAAEIYSALRKRYPAAMRDCTPLSFSKLMAQIGKRVHTKYGNGYWVRSKL